jgi:hypothetical protein
LGRRLGIEAPVTASLVGVCFSGLFVGILANFACALIRPYILTSLAAFGCLTLWDIKNANKFFNKRGTALALCLFALLLFYFNRPGSIFIFDGAGRVMLRFNGHYSYYASQPTEMLTATYLDRLRISNLYPMHWARYHFFGSAIIAIVESLVPWPGLFSYLMAKTVLMVLVFVSFLESFLQFVAPTPRNVFKLAIWLGLGLTFFQGSMLWNMTTTGTFSVFAIVHLAGAIVMMNAAEGLLFAFVLGASAFRMMPVAAVAIAGFLYLRWRQSSMELDLQSIKRFARSVLAFDPLRYAGVVAFLIYNVLTIHGPLRVAEEDLVSSTKFHTGWLYLLTPYRLIGYVGDHFFHGRPYPDYAANGFFDLFQTHFWVPILFFVVFGSLLALVAACLLQSGSGRTVIGATIVVTIAVVASGVLRFLSRDIFHLSALSLLPLFLAAAFVLFARQDVRKFQPPSSGAQGMTAFAVLFTVALQLVSVLFQCVGSTGTSVPVAYIMYDIFLWGIIGWYLMSSGRGPVRLGISVCLGLLVLFFPLRLAGVVRLFSDRVTKAIDITPLMQGDFQRDRWVGNDRMSKFAYDDPNQDDVYSSILGSRLRFSEKYQGVVNYPHIAKADLK